MTKPILLFGDPERHPTIFYRSGFLAPDPVVVIDNGGSHTTLWVNELEFGRAQKESKVGQVRCTADLHLQKHAKESDGWILLVAAICREHGINSVVVERDFPVVLADGLRGGGVTVDVDSDLYVTDRRTKTAQEIADIADVESAGIEGVRRAIDIIKKADIHDGLLCRDGRPLSGNDLVLAVESRLLEFNCTTTGSICCGGPDCADPHCAVSDVLRVGFPIVLDIFPFHKRTRMWGDLTRTVVRGTPPPEVQAMWDAVCEAQQRQLDAVRPGANGRDIHNIARDLFASSGFASLGEKYSAIPSTARFIHTTGHGVGLEIHEFPRIGDADVILQTGDAVTVEPGLYDPQFGGIRIEDLVIVTDDGCRNLTGALEKVFRLD